MGLGSDWDGTVGSCGLGPWGYTALLPHSEPQACSPSRRALEGETRNAGVSDSSSLSEPSATDSFCLSSSGEFQSTLNVAVIVW